MTVRIVDVRMAPSGRSHEAISHYLWEDDSNGTSNWAEKTLMVEWVRRNPNKAWVVGPAVRALLEVIENPGGEAYLRTRADGVLSDNLLSLPGAQG